MHVKRRLPKVSVLWIAVVGLIAGLVPVAAQAVGGRSICVTNGTGVMRYLPACPADSWRAAIAGVSGPAGPQGPQGPKGDPGDNALVIRHATLTLTASTPASTSVTVTGLPAYLASAGQAYGSNADGAPAGVIFTVNAPAPSVGSTTRTFTLSGVSVAAGKTFTLDVWVAAVA